MSNNNFRFPHKNRRKHNQYFKLLFSTIKLHSVTSNQISTYRKLNLYLKSTIHLVVLPFTAQKMKFSIKDLFSICDQIHRKPRIWSHLLKKALMEKFIFCAVSRNGKTTQTEQSILHVFILFLKRNDPQTFKRNGCKNCFLQFVCYWYDLLRWMLCFSLW